jgi:phage baseplate assembly protein W|tara:strand:- start:375 stop:791 length:417 start_codon:yes stop_codon:yes gene_type:complete
MAFGAVQKFPNDTKPRIGIGVNIPFNEGGVFTPNYTTSKAIKNNLINYFLTNPGERPGNPSFGGGLRRFIFNQISTDNIDYLIEDIQSKLSNEFPNVILNTLNVDGGPENTDNNTITVEIFYSVKNMGISDELTLNFA